MTGDTSDLCRNLAIAMTRRPSVTGTDGEANFAAWLADELRHIPLLGRPREVWTFPVAPDDARHCVAMLVRGRGSETILLTGHYDTVTTEDYGDLEPMAHEPDALGRALAARVADATSGTREALVREDLTSGRFLPGRGLLDMKAGLAAGLAAMSALARSGDLRGSLLFIAVPDEENASAGARAAAAALPRLLADRGLHLRLVINLDAIADDGDGTAGRSIALGTVGKVLPTALIVGTPVHSGFPLRGINAAVLAAAIAARVEWAPELTDDTGPHAGTPVSLLSLKDGKSGYDVTTPATTFATWSALNQTRDPASVLPAMAQLTREAVDEMMRVLAERASASDQVEGLVLCRPQVAILCYGDLLSSLRETDPAIDDWQNAEAARIARSGASLPEMCEALTLRLWQRSGRAGPAVILGLGSVPYLATVLEDASIERAVDAMIRQAGADHGVTLSAISYFPGISDMSFFGQSQSGGLLDVSAHTPGWDVLVGLDRRDLAGVPTVNLGPWGRDYHTPYERIDVDYGFRVLPDLVADLVRRVFA